MRDVVLSFILIVLMGATVFGQAPKKADKFIGEWRYKYDLGVEVWELRGDVLFAESFRKNKFGDSTKVEEIKIRKAGKLFIHDWTTYNIVQDSMIVNSTMFVSTSNKYKFQNIEGVTPYMISYSFGFLNRNKLKIKVQLGVNEKPTVFILDRIR